MNPNASRPSGDRTLRRYFLPIVVAIAYILPRIIHAQFGLLDDAVIFTVAPNVVDHPTHSFVVQQASGRFVPGYWLYWAFWYWLVGATPTMLYVGNGVILVAAVTGIVAVMARCGATVLEGWIAAILFTLSAPAAEAYFTLCKGEPAALVALLLSVISALTAPRSRRPVWWWLLAFLMGVAAVATRETAIAMVGTAIGWAVVSLLWPGTSAPISRKGATTYAFVLMAGAIPVFIGAMLVRRGTPTGAYASQYRITPDALIYGLGLRSHELLRDWPGVVVLLVCGAWLLVRRQARRPHALLMMLVWAAASVAILLPWADYHPYYWLNFAAAACAFSALMIGELRALHRDGRLWASVALCTCAAMFAVTGLNSATAARYQIMVDEANARLVAYLRQLPPNSVVLTNMTFSWEYVFEIALHVQGLGGRSDIRVEPLTFASAGDRDATHPSVVITPIIRHGRTPGVRGVLPDGMLNSWEHAWLGSRKNTQTPLAELTEAQRMADVATDRLWCAPIYLLEVMAPAYCPPEWRPLIDLGRTQYGWRVDAYQTSTQQAFAASFNEGTWTFEAASASPPTLAFGRPGDVPIVADWDGDGRVEPGVFRPVTRQWLVDLTMDGKDDVRFELPDMVSSDRPVAGDWTGAGKALPGFYHPEDGSWHLFAAIGSKVLAMPVLHFGHPMALPIVGDWDGDGRQTPGLFQPESTTVILINSFRDAAPQFAYVMPAGQPVVANWSGIGVDTVNVARSGVWARRFANCNCETSNPPAEFAPSLPSGIYFVGRWQERPTESRAAISR